MNIHTFFHWALLIMGALGALAVVAVCVLLVVGGIFAGAAYTRPWSPSYAQGFSDPRVQLVANGELAPNGHNMQPWKVILDKTDAKVMYLYVDTDKLTPAVDPLYRQTLVSQGTFLEYMQVAGQKLGIGTSIALFPNGQYDEKNIVESMKALPVAKVTIATTQPASSGLYDYMFLADTNRESYKPDPLTSTQVSQLVKSNTDETVSVIVYQDEANLTKLGKFANAGTEIESAVHSTNVESANVFRANEYQKNQYGYGFSVEGQGTTGFMKYLLQGLITLFPSLVDEQSSMKTNIASTKNAVAHTPAYAMLLTKDNSRVSQVKAGMAYSKLVLTAHSAGLVMQPPSQVLEEYPEMATQYALIHKEYAPSGDTIQMFFRVGQPTKAFPVSIREDVMKFISN